MVGHVMAWALPVLLALNALSCTGSQEEKKVMSRDQFGLMPDGTSIDRYHIQNARGMAVSIVTYGGIVTTLTAPDRSGRYQDVVLGYDSLSSYLEKNDPYFGALIGRFGNRIARGKFTMNGQEYSLAANNAPNHLHGGVRGFDKVVWKGEQKGDSALVLTYVSKDGEEGYPGTLYVRVTYTLTAANELRIDYYATADAATFVNLTHHSYFNLTGTAHRDILDHQLFIDADQFTPVDSTLIPSGELRSVAETPFDFRTPTAIGARIGVDDDQLRFAGGYDHNFVLNKNSNALTLVARAYEPASGRVLEVYSTEPGLQFYSGNFLNGSHIGKGGAVYKHRFGFCLETQHFPDSPNKPQFPSTLLEPGQTYTSTTVYRFAAK